MPKQPRARKIFLSHKQQFAREADELHAALKLAVPGATVFQSEDIEKSEDFRATVDWQLDRAKCFVLLYTSPEKDWSWCFYEAGRFSSKGRKSRPVVCLRPKAVELPSPLAHLQGIVATRDDILKWLEGDFFDGVRSRQPDRANLDKAVAAIENLVNRMPTTEKTFKPYLWIVPKAQDDWSKPSGRKIDFSNSRVEIDEISARELRFAAPPNLELLPFLRRIACDTVEQLGKIEFWITKFFESLQSAVEEKTNFQEEAYFRYESGKILRPVVTSYVKCANGTVCSLRVVFAEAFGSPLTDSPGLVQRLSIGARLAVRTRLEVIDPFIGRLSQIQQEKSQSTRDEDEIGRKFAVGGRLLEALDTIFREAASHGLRLGEDPPHLFDGVDQQHYESLRDRAEQVWSRLGDAAKQDDVTGDYSETERLLVTLKEANEEYLELVLPRIEQLLVPEKKRRVRQ